MSYPVAYAPPVFVPPAPAPVGSVVDAVDIANNFLVFGAESFDVLELADALRNYGFEQLKLKEITATITPDNIPSKKIAERLGLKFDKKIVLLGVETDLYRLSRTISSPVI